jgi:DNA-directed RNA polymerase specialized sigma24 family protein
MLRYCLSTPGGRAAYLLDRHYDDLVKRAPGACPSPVSRRTAADAVQEVLAQVARPDCAAPDRPGELFAWAVVAVRRTNARLVHDLLARAHEPLGEHVAGYSADPADVVAERSEAVERLCSALAHVPAGRNRAIAVLHALAYGRDEIAAHIGATPREVRRVVERFQIALTQEEWAAAGRR